jgi:hypothetical protein
MIEQRSSEFALACDAIYEKIVPELERTHRGQIVAVEPISGEYFIGGTVREALALANIKYPGRPVFFYRVGSRAVYKIG